MTIDAWLMIAAVVNLMVLTVVIQVGYGTTWATKARAVITLINFVIAGACIYRLIV